MRRALVAAALAWLSCVAVRAHDIGSTPITWNREISRLVYDKCASCHRPGGSSFSLMQYTDVQPRAVAIRDAVLERRMPPWGAVKGFGDFRNDQGLTPEEMEIVVSWADGGVPEGEDKDLAPAPKISDWLSSNPEDGFAINGEVTLTKPFTIDGLLPESMPDKGSFQITATRPDGSVEPLLWLEQYNPKFAHPFLFRTPVELPSGTVIRGVPPGSKVVLLKPGPKPPPEPATTAAQTH